MDPRRRVIISLFAVVALVIGFYVFSDWFSKATGYALGEDQKIKFASCLRESRSVLYLTTDCADCDKQRQILGEEAYAIIEKFTCDKNNLCNGLKGVPAWEINGNIFYGVKEYKDLDELSPCMIDKP